MTCHLRIGFLLFLALQSSGTAAMQTETQLHVSAPVHPVLVRNEHGAIFRVEITLPADQTDRLKALTFSFDKSDDVNDLETLELYSTGLEERFAAKQLVGSATPKGQVRFEIDEPLKPGRNNFWLSARLKATANIDHIIRTQCESMETNRGVVTPPAPVIPAHRLGTALRKHQDDGVHTYRIPALGTTVKGSLLCVYDMRRRSSRDLQEDIDIGLSRSSDGGRSWEPVKVIMDRGPYGGLPEEQNGFSDPGLIIDHQTGEIFVFALWMHGKPGKHQWREDGSEPGFEIGATAQLMVVRSTDDGQTWSAPENLTRQLKKENWWLLAPSPQQGIQLADGTLVMPMQGRAGGDWTENFATIMVSQDHGQSWTMASPGHMGGNECQAAALRDGSIMLNVRNGPVHRRAVVVTQDLGKTWNVHPTSGKSLVEPTCNGSLRRIEYSDGTGMKDVLLFANPASEKARVAHTLKVSFDDGMTWPTSHHLLLDEGRGAGYPSLTQIDNEFIGIVYEGSQAHLTFQRFRIADLVRGK